jgi:hypothetical protein
MDQAVLLPILDGREVTWLISLLRHICGWFGPGPSEVDVAVLRSGWPASERVVRLGTVVSLLAMGCLGAQRGGLAGPADSSREGIIFLGIGGG